MQMVMANAVRTAERIAREREARETPRTDPRFADALLTGAALASKPRLEMRITVFSDQSGRLYIVQHGGEPIRLGIDQRRAVLPPMVMACTGADMELIAESLCYEVVRHVAGSSRAARVAHRVQHELARIPVSSPDVRRRVRDGGKAA